MSDPADTRDEQLQDSDFEPVERTLPEVQKRLDLLYVEEVRLHEKRIDNLRQGNKLQAEACLAEIAVNHLRRESLHMLLDQLYAEEEEARAKEHHKAAMLWSTINGVAAVVAVVLAAFALLK